MKNQTVNNVRHAIHVYQSSRRDNDMSYCYPIEKLCSEHGNRIRSYWILRDEYGYVATVTKDGKVL